MNVTQRFTDLFEDWWYLAHRDGIRTALPLIFSEMIRLPFRHLQFLVFACDINGPLPNYTSKTPIEIRPFEQSDLQFVKEMYRPSEVRQCALHLKSGHKGLIAFIQDQPAGYAWGCADVNPKIEKVPIQLKPGEMLCTDVFTNPSLRGQGVQTSLSLARFRLFRDLGFSKAICYIEIHNAPSLAVWQKKLGGQKIGTIDFLRIGPWHKVQVQSTKFEQQTLMQES